MRRIGITILHAAAACAAMAVLVACEGGGSQVAPIIPGITKTAPGNPIFGTAPTPIGAPSPIGVPTPAVSPSSISGLPGPSSSP